MQNGKFYRSVMLFLIPMLYSFKTRYKGNVGISAWGVKYFLPVFFISYGLQGFSFVRFALGLLFLYSLYEIGYIQNDCETIKREDKPTMRISSYELSFYEKNKVLIYMIRSFEFIVWLSLLYVSGTPIFMLLYGLMTLPFFFLYNWIRNGFCLVVHLMLMLFRYSVPVFFSVNYFSIKVLLFMLAVYPLTLFVERSVKGKFGYRNAFFSKYLMREYADRYNFRVNYYAVLFVITVVLVCSSVFSYMFLIPVGILLFTSIINAKNDKLHYSK